MLKLFRQCGASISLGAAFFASCPSSFLFCSALSISLSSVDVIFPQQDFFTQSMTSIREFSRDDHNRPPCPKNGRGRHTSKLRNSEHMCRSKIGTGADLIRNMSRFLRENCVHDGANEETTSMTMKIQDQRCFTLWTGRRIIHVATFPVLLPKLSRPCLVTVGLNRYQQCAETGTGTIPVLYMCEMPHFRVLGSVRPVLETFRDFRSCGAAPVLWSFWVRKTHWKSTTGVLFQHALPI